MQEKIGAEGRNRTGTSREGQGILSPLRLPVPPPPHAQGTTTVECPTIFIIAKASAPRLTEARVASIPERVYHGTGGKFKGLPHALVLFL